MRCGQAACLAAFVLFSMAAGQEAETVHKLDDATSQALLLVGDENLPADAKVSQLAALAEANKKNGTVWVAYGEALEAADRDDEALAAFDRAADADPTLYSAWQWIGTLNKRLRLDLPRAEMAFLKAREMGAPAAPVNNELGVTLAMQGKFDEALAAFDAALLADPDWGILYNNAIKAAIAGRRTAKAREYFIRAIDAKRFEQNGLLMWGDYLMQSGEHENAAADYQLALAKHPDNARIRYDRGAALSRMGKKHREAAVAELTRAREDARKAGDSWTVRGAERTLFAVQFPDEEKKFQAAVKDVFAMEKDPERKVKQAEGAIKRLNPIVERHPDFFNARFTRAVALRMAGDNMKAREDLEHVLKLHPDEGNALIQMALLMRDEGELKEATGYARRAAEAAPRDPTVLMNAAFIELDAGNCPEAVGLCDQVDRLAGPGASEPVRVEISARCK